MEPYGLGEEILVDNLELMILQIDLLQSQHLVEEQIGNKLTAEIKQEQSKLMELYGIGDLI